MFYDKLRKLCMENGTNISTVVSELGLSSGNLSKWKNGGYPRASTVQKIADRLGVTMETLLSEEEEATHDGSTLTLNDIQYALYHETASLSDDTMNQILEFARFAKMQEKKREKGLSTIKDDKD